MLESLNAFKFVMALINLVILYFVLRKILFKPVMKLMGDRAKSIEGAIADASRQRAEAAEMRAAYEERMKAARAESKKIIDAAVAKAEARQAGIVAEAKRQAEELLARAGEEIEQERGRMLGEVRSEVASLAFAAAARVLEANMDTKSNRALVKKFLDEAGAA